MEPKLMILMPPMNLMAISRLSLKNSLVPSMVYTKEIFLSIIGFSILLMKMKSLLLLS